MSQGHSQGRLQPSLRNDCPPRQLILALPSSGRIPGRHSTAFPFDIVSSLDESLHDDQTQKSAKKAKKIANDMEDMEMENLEVLQQVLHAKILKRKSMEPTSMEPTSMEPQPKT